MGVPLSVSEAFETKSRSTPSQAAHDTRCAPWRRSAALAPCEVARWTSGVCEALSRETLTAPGRRLPHSMRAELQARDETCEA
eukprot:scaffold227432_cov28-Tisochrysis_lutea.AAC.2